MTKYWIILLIAVAAAYGGYTAARKYRGDAEQSPAAKRVVYSGPRLTDYKLTDQQGETFDSHRLDGHVTLTKFRHFECFQTSWLWCDGREATRMPADAQPYPLCHTKGQTFPNGDWVAGYYLACSACTGNCEGGR